MSFSKEPYPALAERIAVDPPLVQGGVNKPSLPPKRRKILLVDDNDTDILLEQRSLEKKDWQVVTATTVTEALKLISTQAFDALVTDLHMPEAGDGFAVVTAMHHFHPGALTVVVSDFPDVQRAMAAVLSQADEVLLKPSDTQHLAEIIEKHVMKAKSFTRVPKKHVASILEQDLAILMKRWLSRVEEIEELTSLPLTAKERSEYLPGMIGSITARLRGVRSVEAIDSPSPAAVAHGQLRYQQGYSAPLIVQESRILQVCIFETIERNLSSVEFSTVLPDIMIIADEVDSQLKQTIDSFLTIQRGS